MQHSPCPCGSSVLFLPCERSVPCFSTRFNCLHVPAPPLPIQFLIFDRNLFSLLNSLFFCPLDWRVAFPTGGTFLCEDYRFCWFVLILTTPPFQLDGGLRRLTWMGWPKNLTSLPPSPSLSLIILGGLYAIICVPTFAIVAK